MVAPPRLVNEGDNHAVKVIVVGRSGCGKTSLLLRYLRPDGSLFSATVASTAEANVYSKRVGPSDRSDYSRIELWDTTALGSSVSEPQLYRAVHGVVVVHDFELCHAAADTQQAGVSFLESDEFSELVRTIAITAGWRNEHEALVLPPVVIFGNKTDSARFAAAWSVKWEERVAAMLEPERRRCEAALSIDDGDLRWESVTSDWSRWLKMGVSDF